MDFNKYIIDEFKNSIKTKQETLQNKEIIDNIEFIANKCIEAYKCDKKVIICGNGGSASDALHFVGELVGRYRMEREGLNAICLSSNTVNLTAISNDYHYDYVYSKQLKAIGKKGDIFIGISTSGDSVNIKNAFQVANESGIYSVLLSGKTGGICRSLADKSLIINSDITSHIQETHILILHIIAGLIENGIFKN